MQSKVFMAKKKKFHFNSDTLSYEQIEHTITHWLKQILIHTLSGVSLGAVFFFIFVSTVSSPEEKQLGQVQNRIEPVLLGLR